MVTVALGVAVDLVAFRVDVGIVALGVAVELLSEVRCLTLIGVGEVCGGAPTGLSRIISSGAPGLPGILGYATSAGGLVKPCCGDVADTDGCFSKCSLWVKVCSALVSSTAGASFATSGSGSGSGCSFFALVVRVVLVRLDLVVLARPPAPLRLPFVVAVEAVDMVDMTDISLASMDSSNSGISMVL